MSDWVSLPSLGSLQRHQGCFFSSASCCVFTSPGAPQELRWDLPVFPSYLACLLACGRQCLWNQRTEKQMQVWHTSRLVCASTPLSCCGLCSYCSLDWPLVITSELISVHSFVQRQNQRSRRCLCRHPGFGLGLQAVSVPCMVCCWSVFACFRTNTSFQIQQQTPGWSDVRFVLCSYERDCLRSLAEGSWGLPL